MLEELLRQTLARFNEDDESIDIEEKRAAEVYLGELVSDICKKIAERDNCSYNDVLDRVPLFG